MAAEYGAEWRSYCVYAGRHLPEDALSDEHVIPKSLGGGNSTLIRASRELNSRFGREIDGKIANDPIIQFGRRDANARGHSGTPPIPRWKGLRPWKSGPFDASKECFNIDFPTTGGPTLYDTRRGRGASNEVLVDRALVATNLQIDSDARAKFCAKTLLGIGWRLFGPHLLSAVSVNDLRAFLGVEGGAGSADFRMTYLDPFVADTEAARSYVKMIEKNLVRARTTTILARETDGELEWSLACVGYFVGSLVLPTTARLLPAEILPEGGLLLIAGRGTLQREVLAGLEAG